MDIKFEHFCKLQKRYWEISPLINPEDLINTFTTKIEEIEKRDFGKKEDKYIITTQAKIILNGLILKVYYFLKNSILHSENKQYISAISLLRLCIEHMVMLSYFEDKLSTYLKESKFEALLVLLHSFSHGQRIMFINLIDADTNKKVFSSRAEHVSDALRLFDKKFGGGIQLIYDMFSDHTHVTPTSAVRMLLRQKNWQQNEIKINYDKINLSTTSNSHEKLACGGVETLLQFLKIIDGNIIYKQNELWKSLEIKGNLMELNEKVNPDFYKTVDFLTSEHDAMIGDFMAKLEKYKKLRPIIK